MVHSSVTRSAGIAVPLLHGQLQPAERQMRTQNGLILDTLLQPPGRKAWTHRRCCSMYRICRVVSLPIVQEAMRDFRSGKASVLVATDVAGRGLHISRWIL